MAYRSRIIENFERTAPHLIERLSVFSTPDLCDIAGIYDCMDSTVKPYVAAQKIVGTALTVRVPPGEGGIIPSAIEMALPNDILVIAGKGNLASAYWGDQRSASALKRGVRGVVIDGAFRDIDDCEKLGLPVFAKGLTCGSSGKAGTGEINVAISCAGVVVCPGDVVFGDRNGVCIIPRDAAEDILLALEKAFPHLVK